MPIDVAKITENRRAQREATQAEMRPGIALEQIADTLEAIRAEFVLYQALVAGISRTPPQR